MRYALTALVRNLVAGARLASFVRVDRTAFRVDLVQWVLIVVVSALVDIALDGVRAAPDASWSPLGVNGELFALGLLMVTSAVIAMLCRDAALFVALPIATLAAFPLLQVVHALPAALHFDLPEPWSTAFEIAMLAWMVLLCVRAVHVLSESPKSRRIVRALAGGLLLSLPLWFAPLAGPFEGWWSDDEDQAAAPADTNPASEPVMAVQSYLLDQALDNLDDERPGITDLYFVGFAPDSRQDGFRRELDLAQRVLDERFDTRGRSITLLNHPDTATEVPFATLTNLRRVLQELGDAIDPDDDIVMLYLTGAPDPENGLAAVLPPLELVPITPESVEQLLDSANIRFRVIVVSTCAAGAWIDALQSEDSAVLVSSPAQSHAPGCAGSAQPSPFSEALFGRALHSADSIPAAFAQVVHDLTPQGGTAPQLWMGRNVEAQLKQVKRGPPIKTAALHGAPFGVRRVPLQ
jgi:hypothetical protein